MQVEPYLSFEGRCEEALNFYQQALGAQVGVLMRNKDAPPMEGGAPKPPEGCEPEGSSPGDKILHAAFTVGGSTLMATDGMNSGKPDFKGISLSLAVDSEAEARRLFNALADGGQVRMPLAQTFFSPAFGMVADRFGVSWMVMTNP
jgi:PhnB protein